MGRAVPGQAGTVAPSWASASGLGRPEIRKWGNVATCAVIPS